MMAIRPSPPQRDAKRRRIGDVADLLFGPTHRDDEAAGPIPAASMGLAV